MAREFTRVGVVGLGTMGAGIATVFVRSGIAVVGVESDASRLDRARKSIADSLERSVVRGTLSEQERADALDRLELTTSFQPLADVEVVLEAVPEDLAVKRGVLAEIDKVCAAETILATNTAALPVTELAVATGRPSRVVGMHFFAPATRMELVEVVRTVMTEPDVLEDVQALVEQVGKTPALSGDRTGFIVNALIMPYLNHAVTLFENSYATREDLDAAMRYGTGLPMGPLTLLDMIGLDAAYHILDAMYHETRDHLHAPAPLLKQYVSAGMLGRKSGRGFYTYEAPGSSVVVPDALTPPSGSRGEGARAVTRIGVVGTGTMASGIVEVCAKAGYDVVFRARTEAKAQGVADHVKVSLQRQVDRGRLSEPDRDATVERLTGTTALEDLSDCDLVIEAVAEDLDVKRAIFGVLGQSMKPGAVLATTTSSLPVIECAQAAGRPNDVVGMHFFNPATIMKLVEVVPTVASAPDAVATIHAVCERLGKVAVECGDRAGFIVNALLFPYLNDAVKMVEGHYASVEDVDTAIKAGVNYPMGPFALLDVVGLDVSLAIQETLYTEFREPGLAPAPLLEHMVQAGYLGRKTGRGFKDYRKK